MKTIKSKIFLLLLIIAVAIPIFAKTYPHDGAGVSVTIPDGWEVDGDEDSLHASSKSGEVAISFVILPYGTANAAMNNVQKELGKTFKGYKTTQKSEPITWNGMKGFYTEGDGSVDGVPMHVDTAILKSPTGKVVMVLGAAAKRSFDKYEKQITGILKSLKPL
jgi:predicted Zn-dependent protease